MDFDYTNETITPDTTGSINIGGTGAFGVPIGTTAQAITPSAGLIRYDSTINQLTWSNASNWTTLSTGNTFKVSTLAATTADLAAASNTASTITGTLVVFPAQDGITLAVNNRLLVKNQTAPAQNGIYTLTTVGVAATTAWVLTRSIDADVITELASAIVSVDSGTLNGGLVYFNNTKTTDTLGTTAVTWSRNVDLGYLPTYLLSPGAIGTTTPAAGKFANLEYTGTLTVPNTNLVTNLNADLLDGNHASVFLLNNIANPTVGNGITGQQIFLNIANPGIGYESGFNFLKNNDSAGISVTENTTDATVYEFFMWDNPDGGDFFSWRFGDWQGGNSLWNPLLIGELESTYTARNHSFYGNIIQPQTGAYYTTRVSAGVGTGANRHAYSSPTNLPVSVAGTITITALNVTGFTGTSGAAFFIKFDSTTTFAWGYGQWQSATPTQSGLSIASPPTLSNGVIVTFSGSTGGVLADAFQCRIWKAAVNSLGATTINSTVKLPNVGTSGFVKLGAGGQLSADTTVYGTGTVTSVAALSFGTTGTDVSSSIATGTTTPVITLNIPTASAANRGALSSTDWTTFNNKGSGSVTGATFTGGLISVSGSATLAFVVAGTSGGIPYFSSASVWASSAALAANALVIGGGAGVAPSTTTTGTSVLTALGVAVGTAGGVVVNGGVLGTPSSGTVTNLTGTASININGTVGATTATTGVFTQLSVNGANLNTSISPTGTSTVTISPDGSLTLGTAGVTASVLGNISAITSGQTIALQPTGAGTVTIGGSSTGAVTISPSGSGSLTINPTTIGSISNMAGSFTTLDASSTVSGTGFSTYLASPPAIGGTSAANGTFAALAGTLTAETYSTSAGVTAGTNAQGQGTLTSDYNVITTATTNPSGVTLPTATTGRRVIVVNKGANPIAVFPATSGAIDALSSNASIAIPVAGWMEFNASSATQWYSSYNITSAGGGTATASYTRTSFTATAAQTSFGTVTYTVGYVEVFLNGVLLNSTDYTASTGSTIVLALAAALGDIIETIAYNVSVISITDASTLSTGTVAVARGGTGQSTAPAALSALLGYTSVVTAAGTTTLTNTSTYNQFFTGTTTQTVVLPVTTSSFSLGWTFKLVNNSTGIVTVQASSNEIVLAMPAGTTTEFMCISTAVTTNAAWYYDTLGGTGPSLGLVTALANNWNIF